jgi:uncharacterized repeat protein (TIGR01451 family)
MERAQRHLTQTCALALALAGPIGAASAQGDVIELKLDRASGQRTVRKDAQTGKVGSSLLALYQEYRAHQDQLRAGIVAAGTAFRPSDGLARVRDGYVEIEAIAATETGGLVSELEAMGLHDARVLGRLVSGQLPIAEIEGLANVPSLQFARPSYALTNAGPVTTQGDRAIRADQARAAVGVTGSGVTVGVISDSFNCLGGAGSAKAAGDLPSDITVLESPEQDGICGVKDDDEGRAMMEIIHDVAPGAALSFHTFRGGQAGFADAIRTLAAGGADVIVDDTINLAEPMFQDGAVAQAVDEVNANGVAFFSAGGNDGRDSYESPFSPSATSFSYGKGACTAHDFDTGGGVDTRQTVKIPSDREARLVFQWDEPFASVSGAPGSASDIDILLLRKGTDTVVARGAAVNTGGDPVELVFFYNNTLSELFDLAITRCAGPDPALMKYVVIGSATIVEYDNDRSTIYGHANASGAETTGAAWYIRTPEFGVTPPHIEHFSAVGGTPILFDTLGNRIAPETRDKPAIVAPDGVDTRFFGSADLDHTGRPNFFGTSAAAAHAAGVAALMSEANPALAPAQIYAVLEQGAIDMDDPGIPGFDAGFDFASGHGLIQADVSVAEVARNADLAVTVIGAPDPVTVGQALSYTVRIDNQGPETAEGVTLTDLLPATALPVSALPSQGTCAGGAVLGCALGQMASGASATVTVVVTPQTRGQIRTTASVTGHQRDPDGADNRAEQVTTVAPLPGASDLSIAMTDTPDPVAGGGALTYAMTVTNSGPDEVGGVAVTDVVPNGASLLSAAASQGGCVGTTELTCNLGMLAVGSSATVTLVVAAPGQGPLGNTASVLGNRADPDPSDDSTTELTGVEVPLCGGRPATLVGTEGNDFLFGTPGNDVIAGLGGNDRIDGQGGNDVICGGSGFDRLLGSGGRDRIDGGSDGDRMSGGRGRDRLFGGTGNDNLRGNQGSDVLKGGRGRDRLDGGPGTDVCKGRHKTRCER